MTVCPFLPQLTDDEAMRAARLVPREVALLLLDAFSEMVFVHGRVHADPHPGNLLVRPLKDPKQGALTLHPTLTSILLLCLT